MDASGDRSHRVSSFSEEVQMREIQTGMPQKGTNAVDTQLPISEDDEKFDSFNNRKSSVRRSSCTNSSPIATLSDQDLEELKGCIELGFSFGLEDDLRLCSMLPALSLLYAVNRGSPGEFRFPATMPHSDDSKMMKVMLKHWAQVVACSIRQYYCQ